LLLSEAITPKSQTIKYQNMKNGITTEGLTQLHTSLIKGYVSRKNADGIVLKYKGRFGEGVRVLSRNFDSTRFCFVTYFVK